MYCKRYNKRYNRKFFFFYEHPNDDKISFTKNALKYILLKFRQFNDYVDYFNDKNNNKFINNLLINKNNLSLNDKINIFSILLNIIMSSPIYYENTKIEFFNINLNDKNVYLLANNLLKKIIDKLNPNSQYLKGLKQTFSRIKKDLNILNHKNKKENNTDIFIIEMISLEELKEKIKSFIPSRIIRFVNSRSFTNALYDIISGDIIINEITYKNRGIDYHINNNDNIIFDSLDPIIKGDINLNDAKNKFDYNFCIFQALFRINHEALGHKPVAKINNNKLETPNKFLYNGSFRDAKDAGNILEYFIAGDSIKFNSLKNQIFNAEILLNEELFIDVDFNEFWDEFENLDKINKDEKEKEDNIKQLYDYIYDIYDENIILKIDKFVRYKNLRLKDCRKLFKFHKK